MTYKQRMEVLYITCMRGKKEIEKDLIQKRHKNLKDACEYDKFEKELIGSVIKIGQEDCLHFP